MKFAQRPMTHDGYALVCNGCSEDAAIAHTQVEAIYKAHEEGWLTIWDHGDMWAYCPTCRKAVEK